MVAEPIDLKGLFKGIPAGAWVAISHDWKGIIAVGFSPEEVTGEAQAAGEAQPILMKIPEAGASLLL